MTAKAALVIVSLLFTIAEHWQEVHAQASDPVVTTTSGTIRGQNNSTVEQGKPFCSFQGIPFAEPPVGNLRFEPPVPKTPWTGVFSATKAGKNCVQDGESDEDCLVLNVYTPQINPSQPLPVIVYYYGGGFRGGSSNYTTYGPDYLLEKDVVVVTSNYRLGIFGFLSTGTVDGVPGNMGLKDQVLVMKWVKDNIAGFGGDPGQVTIMGQSSGSASVAYHIHSRLSQGLFQKAIMESGVSFSGWSYSRNSKKVAALVAQNFNINVVDSRALVKGLKTIPASDLQTAASAKELASYLEADPRQGFAYAPVIEPEHDGAFLTEASYELMARGDFSKVPCLIGYNSLEGTFAFPLILRAYLLKYDALPQEFVPASLNAVDAIEPLIGTLIKLHYFGLVPTAVSNQTLMKFISDDQFVRPIRQYALLLSKYVPTYFYRFSYLGRLAGWGPDNPRPGDGVAHGEEVWYMWRSKYEPSLLDRVTRARMLTMWTNFVKYGNPTPTQDTILQNQTWPTTDAQHTYLDIGNDLVVSNNPQPDDMAFWDDIFAKNGRRPYITY